MHVEVKANSETSQQIHFSPANRTYILLILLAVLLAILYSQVMLTLTGGTWILPLDDAYIYLQYARNLAHGHFFQFNPGDPPSTGTTSLLYPIFLMFGFLLGLDGDHAVVFTFVLNTVLLTASLILVYRLMQNLFDSKLALFCAISFALCGPLTWGFFSGMEIGMLIALFLITAFVWMHEEQSKRYRWTPFLLAILAISRPETMIFVALFVFILLLRRSHRKDWLLICLPMASVAAVLIFNYALTGSISPNTSRAKSPWYTPYFSFLFILQHATNYFDFSIKALFFGTYTQPVLSTLNRIDEFSFVPPLSMVLYLIGGLPPAIQEIREGRLGTHVFLNLWFLSGFLAIGILSGTGGHHFRYLLPFFSVFVIYLFPGLRIVTKTLHTVIKSSQIENVFAAAFLFFQVITTSNFILLFGQAAHTFREFRDVASWANKNLAPNSRIAALDIGMIGFYSDRYIYDLFGLATNEMTRSTFYFADYMGSKYEQMKKLPPEKRPQYFFLHRVRFDEGADQGHLQPFRQTLIYKAAPVSTQFAAIGRDLGIYKFDWNATANSDVAYESSTRFGKLIDSLNTADPDSQKAHDYRFVAALPNYFPSDRAVTAAYSNGTVVMDGALGINGTEQFRFRTSDQTDLVLVLRTLYLDGRPAVYCNGVSIGIFDGLTDGKTWKEIELKIPREKILPGDNLLEIKGRYMSAYYWIFQAASSVK